MKKITRLGLFLTFIAVIYSPLKTFSPLMANQNIVMRFANDNLSSLSDLSSFNIVKSSSSFNVNIDANRGVVMTSSTGQASSLFLKEQMAVNPTSPGFSTYFVMNTYKITSMPADGFVFVIAANSNSLGGTGGSLGYGGITNSLGIEFDFWDNNGEQVASSDMFTNGVVQYTAGAVFDPGYLSKYTPTALNVFVRALHTWIEFDALTNTIELRVVPSDHETPATNRPARPTNPLIQRTNLNLTQISEYYYAGFTAATGGSAQGMALKSWYFSNTFIAGGIAPDAQTIVTDNDPPSSPLLLATASESFFTFAPYGSEDAGSGVSGYQTKKPSQSWVAFNDPVEMDILGEYQARAFDGVGNYSLPSSIYVYNVEFYAAGKVQYTIKRHSQQDDLLIDYVYTDETFAYATWHRNALFQDEPVLSLASQTTTTRLYGKPQRYVFNVDYILNGGTLPVENPSTYSAFSPFLLSDPTRIGFSFAGWYLDEAFTTPYTNQIFEDHVTFFAKWTVNQYTISFVSNGGSSVPSITLDYGSSITTPSDPTRLGYTFAGWFVNETLTIPYLVPTTMLDDNIAVYAKWIINQYTITFETNGGSLIDNVTQDYNSGITKPNDPIKVGHTFAGWFVDSQLTTPYIIDTMPAENITLFASWQANTYTVNFILDDANSFILSGSYGQPVIDILDNRELTKIGHAFAGWYTDATFESPLTESVLITEEEVIIFARWDKHSYRLSFMTDGLVYEENSVIFEGSPTLPSTPTKDGYTFNGWRMNGENFDETFVMPAHDVVVEASFSGIAVNIIFVTESTLTTKIVTSGEVIGSLPILTTTPSYRFIGWSLTFNDPSYLIGETFVVPVSASLRLYPIWEVISDTPTLGGKTRPMMIDSSNLPWVSIIAFSVLTSFVVSGIFITLKRSYGNIKSIQN